MLKKTALGFLFGSVVFGFGCSENNTKNTPDLQSVKPMPTTESSEQLGQSTSAMTVEIDPRTGEFIPGGTGNVQVPEVAPVYEVRESPVSGVILSSSAGFGTPLTATVNCDGKVSTGHGSQALAGDANCQQEKGE